MRRPTATNKKIIMAITTMIIRMTGGMAKTKATMSMETTTMVVTTDTLLKSD